MEQYYGTVRVQCDEALEGETATLTTIKGVNQSITLHAPYTELKLVGMEQYHLHQGSNDEDITLDCGKFVKTGKFIVAPTNLNDATWEAIQILIRKGKFGDYYSVGDYKDITMKNGHTVRMEVVAINDGTGNAGTYYPDKTVDFISVNLFNTSSVCFLSENVQTTPPSSTSLFIGTLTNIYSNLPLDCAKVVINKEHVYGYNQYGSQTLSRKCWVPTRYELFGSSYKGVGENDTNNKMYTLSSKKKGTSINGSWQQWITGSRYYYSSSDNYVWAYHVTSDGIDGYTIADGKSYYVPVCFRVG